MRLSLSCVPQESLAFLEVSSFLTQFFPLWELRVICRGENSVGDYGQQRRLLHAATFGRSDVAMTLLRMEEHAFYLVVIKLTASVAVAFPERLSSEQRVLAYPVGILSKCIGSVLAKKNFATLQ